MTRYQAPAAKWQLGQIEVADDLWATVDHEIRKAKRDSKLESYQQFRESRKDNLEDHLVMARWCQENELPEQRRAHLERVLDFAPDHANARRQLGYRLEAGQWISPSQLAARREIAMRRNESMRQYGSWVQDIANRLNARKRRERDAAAEELMQVRDSNAIGAVEEVLRSPAEQPSNLVIDWMKQVDEVDSSLVLVRYGLNHPHRAVRNKAVEVLKDRPFHDFVPGLMGRLSTPIEMQVQASVNFRGGLDGYRQAFAREGYEQKEFLAFDRGFQRSPSSNFSGNNRVDRRAVPRRMVNVPADRIEEQIVQQQTSMAINSRVASMMRQNATIQETNRRIANVLSEVTGQPFEGDPREMWEWWDRYN